MNEPNECCTRCDEDHLYCRENHSTCPVCEAIEAETSVRTPEEVGR